MKKEKEQMIWNKSIRIVAKLMKCYGWYDRGWGRDKSLPSPQGMKHRCSNLIRGNHKDTYVLLKFYYFLIGRFDAKMGISSSIFSY